MNAVVRKQEILRTSLKTDTNSGELIQCVNNFDEKCYDFVLTESVSDQVFQSLLVNEMDNRKLFDISTGRVFRCHVILHESATTVIFNFFAVAIDGEAFRAFVRDVEKAYRYPDKILAPLKLTYLDLALRENRVKTFEQYRFRDTSLKFWSSYLDNTCSNEFLDKLPYDRKPKDNHRSGHGHTYTIHFRDSTLQNISSLVGSRHVSITQIMLAAVFGFLFKQTGETDIQLSTVYANRQAHPELSNIIGPLVATLPLRCEISPSDTFYCFLRKIKEVLGKVLAHADIPYHEILRHSHAAPLSIFFLCEVLPSEAEIFQLDDKTMLFPGDQKEDYLFDLAFKFSGTTSLSDGNRLSCKIRASSDLYDAYSIKEMAERLELAIDCLVSHPEQSLYTMSILLFHERTIMSSTEQTSSESKNENTTWNTLDQVFAYRAQQHPQKISVVLENQSLSYAELLHYAQILSFHLIVEAHIKPREIVAQCVEKSIEMVR